MKHKRHCTPHACRLSRRIKSLLILFIAAMVLSGLTAFPIEAQLAIASQWFEHINSDTLLAGWIAEVYKGVSETNSKFPFIAYGTDWLAFVHLVIAVAFIGPLKDPVKNIWVIEFGFIAAVAVIPMAFIAGEVRDIPVFWRLIDCMFGVIGAFVLARCYSDIKLLEKIKPISI